MAREEELKRFTEAVQETLQPLFADSRRQRLEAFLEENPELKARLEAELRRFRQGNGKQE